MKPKRIILIRHGQSESNLNRIVHETIPDHRIHLTDLGKAQALAAGIELKEKYFKNNSIACYLSPYVRAKETLENIEKSHISISRKYVDPRLREQDFGNLRSQEAHAIIEKERDAFGIFFYRVKEGGESGADVFDRVSGFLDTLHRDFEKEDFSENVLIVSHGLTIRLFLMRWFHWDVEYFETLRNPKNCQYYVLERVVEIGGKEKYELKTEMVIRETK